VVDFRGVVLTGGASSRMGRDKALLRWDGIPLAARVGAALRAAGAVEVVAVGGDARALADAGLATVPDRWPGDGPLGGMITGLATAGEALVVAAACDLPALDPSLIERLVEALVAADPGEVLAAVPVVDGITQTHLVALRAEARTPLLEAFAAGERAPRRALTRCGLVELVLGPDEVMSLRDVDRPEDLPG
jgi:molybdopterin-guanine dinucleotide biosynthesis protein A